ncbi:Mdm33 family-domain-containing protein [Blakeslea trispora]|nr:Mdm33 family-domain-containing protein [Blakeslea trispora]
MSFRLFSSTSRLGIVRTSRNYSTQHKSLDKYVEQLQNEIRPRLAPYLAKLNQTSEQLKRLTLDVHDSKEAIQRASKLINELTGYQHIEAVKEKVTQQANLFESARDQVQTAKKAYESAIETRSNTQRNINELLQRKHLWTSEDVTRFTELYRLEHQHVQAEVMARENHQACEKQMDREYMALARSIMERYHEEQLWSDKIRSVSTYGTWALMGLNLILFVMVQTVFEPHKRKRLTDRFEELLVAKVSEEEDKFKHVLEGLQDKDHLLMQQQVALMEAMNQLTEHPLFHEDFIQSLKETSSSIPAQETFTLPIETTPSNLDQEKQQMQHENDLLKQQMQHENDLLKQLLATQQEKEEETPSRWLYAAESALAGGLVTAIAIYTFCFQA